MKLNSSSFLTFLIFFLIIVLAVMIIETKPPHKVVITEPTTNDNITHIQTIRLGNVTSQERAESIDIALNNSVVRWFLGYYLFTWDKIPGSDSENERFLNNLSFDAMNWVETSPAPKIEKIDDTTIKIFNENHNATIRLNNKKTNVTVDIDNHSMWYTFIVKTENGNLNVYSRPEKLNYYIEDVYRNIYYYQYQSRNSSAKARYDMVLVTFNFVPFNGIKLFAFIDLKNETVVAVSGGTHPVRAYPVIIP